MARKYFVSRLALALALSTGVGAVALPTAAMAQKAPKISFSKEFSAAAAEFDKTLSASTSDATIKAAADKARAAQTDAERAAAAAQVDAALGGGKAKIDAIAPTVSTPGDKVKFGEMMRTYGVLTADPALQKQGLLMMLDSGALSAASVGQINYLAGITSYQTKDYAGAAKYLQAAKQAGYSDQQGLLEQVLADSYKRTGNTGAALAMAKQEIDAARAAGTKPSETALRTALQAAYDAKQTGTSADLAAMLVQNYPTPDIWNTSISVIRSLTALPSQDNLDLMRLMARTNAMKDKRDYLEYIENADPRRLPGEAVKVIDAGVAAGKLTSSEVAAAKAEASGRISSDKASLNGMSASSASGVAAMGAADGYLSYGQPAKAEEFYTAALSKSGVDKDRAMLRLGIAQADQGKYDAAAATFAKVGGTRAPVAKLWSAYAMNKGGAGAGASATASTAPVSEAATQ